MGPPFQSDHELGMLLETSELFIATNPSFSWGVWELDYCKQQERPLPVNILQRILITATATTI
jgi:hypothetical protein